MRKHLDPIEAVYLRGSKLEAPTVVTATAGASKAVGAIAAPLYAQGKAYGNNRKRSASFGKVAFLADTGKRWSIGGKCGRVLLMLATRQQGVTQWCTLPWHTRLGASIHQLREAGLFIETQREGDCRHARYFLRTPGRLLTPSGNGSE
jgi:hypothetical protein